MLKQANRNIFHRIYTKFINNSKKEVRREKKYRYWLREEEKKCGLCQKEIKTLKYLEYLDCEGMDRQVEDIEELLGDKKKRGQDGQNSQKGKKKEGEKRRKGLKRRSRNKKENN